MGRTGPNRSFSTPASSTPGESGEPHEREHVAGEQRVDALRIRKNYPSIDIVVRVSVWSLSGSMWVRGQTYRGRGDAIWSRRS